MKIAIAYQHPYFTETIFYKLLEEQSQRNLQIVSPAKADMIIYGPFGRELKAFGPFVKRKNRKGLIKVKGRKTEPLHVFQTMENERPSEIYDANITFDFIQNDPTHIRLPYWMEVIDWQHEGLFLPKPQRISRRFTIEELMRPLGDRFTKRNNKCAAFFGHLREPRQSFMTDLATKFEIDGYGPAFDESIKNPSKSGIDKDKILENYSYCLCPENSLYPGYYTEKILEAFACGCLGISWADENVATDFNPNAFINLLPFCSVGYEKALDILDDPAEIEKYQSAPLLLKRPSIEPIREFVKELVAKATS